MLEKFYVNKKPTKLMIRISEVVVISMVALVVFSIGFRIYEVFAATLAAHPEITEIWN